MPADLRTHISINNHWIQTSLQFAGILYIYYLIFE